MGEACLVVSDTSIIDVSYTHLSSCLNSWLDPSPADGIDAETAIKNSDDLANVRTGLYAAVKGNSSLINYYGRLMFVYGRCV